MKLKMVLLLSLSAISASYATAGCDTDQLCDLAGEMRSFHIPYVRGAANQVDCPGSYDETARNFLESAVDPVKNAQTELCSATPDLDDALIEVKAARDAMRLAYVYFGRTISISNCTDPDAAVARDRAYDAWSTLNFMVYLIEYECN